MQLAQNPIKENMQTYRHIIYTIFTTVLGEEEIKIKRRGGGGGGGAVANETEFKIGDAGMSRVFKRGRIFL